MLLLCFTRGLVCRVVVRWVCVQDDRRHGLANAVRESRDKGKSVGAGLETWHREVVQYYSLC